MLVAGHLLRHGQLEAIKEIKEIKAKEIVNPLETTYWSGSPYWLGRADGSVGHAVKYSAVPGPSPLPKKPKGLAANYLSEALAARLRDGEAVFDFKIQTQTDPVRMPVEDASVEWNEGESQPVTVATLRFRARGSSR